MKNEIRRYAKSQSGFTLIELLVASAIGVIVMVGLSSVVLTSWTSAGIATSRIEASSQIRSFQFDAYDDFARSGVPTLNGCAPSGAPPCTISLSGTLASNAIVPVLSPGYTVIYRWDGVNVDRQAGSNLPVHAATNVKAFSASVTTNQTVVVTMTVTVPSYGGNTYSETQTLQFNPRLNP